MNLTNESYVILIGTKNFTEKYYKDKEGWLKISARGKKFRMTAEQVLNHLLPAIAGVKPNIILNVQHYEAPNNTDEAEKLLNKTRKKQNQNHNCKDCEDTNGFNK